MNVYVAWSLVLFVVATAVLVPFFGADSRDGADWSRTAGPAERRRPTPDDRADRLAEAEAGPYRRADVGRETGPDLAPDVFAVPRPIPLPRPREVVARTRIGSDN